MTFFTRDTPVSRVWIFVHHFEFSLKTADRAARLLLLCAHDLPQGEGFGSFFTGNIGRIYTRRRLRRPDALNVWPGLLKAWLVLTSVKYHGNLYILIPLNQRLALTRLRATGPWLLSASLSASGFYTRCLKRLRRLIHLLSASIGRT